MYFSDIVVFTLETPCSCSKNYTNKQEIYFSWVNFDETTFLANFEITKYYNLILANKTYQRVLSNQNQLWYKIDDGRWPSKIFDFIGPW